MSDEKLCTMNYEAECQRLNEELYKKHELLEITKCQIAEQSKTIAHLEGQIRAFEFCVTRGGVDNGHP